MEIIQEKWYKDKHLYICLGLCLMMALISFVPYIWLGDGAFTLMTDFNVQQIPFSIAAKSNTCIRTV